MSGRVRARPLDAFTLAGQPMSLTWDAASRISPQTSFPAPAQANTYGYDVPINGVRL
jgi:YD repeat-containing protein